jgi:hypothetical protein
MKWLEKNGKVEADLLGQSMSIKVVAGQIEAACVGAICMLRRMAPDWDAVMRVAR